LHACLTTNGCTEFGTWGVGDTDSWILQEYPGWGTPLLFDASYDRKPAYYALKSELTTQAAP